MTLDSVSAGDPHVAAHNAERLVINDLEAEIGGRLSQLELDSAYARIPEGIADGQLLAWDEATERCLSVDPSGEGELAYAENATATTTALTTTGGAGASVDIPLCVIVVPASTRPVWLEWGGMITTSVSGIGSVLLSVVEGSTQIALSAEQIPQPTGFGPNFSSISGRRRIGPTSTVRTFKLQALLWTNAADNATVNFENGTAWPTYIGAVAR